MILSHTIIILLEGTIDDEQRKKKKDSAKNIINIIGSSDVDRE